MLTGWPRERRRYPRTDLWEERRARVCSSSGVGREAGDVEVPCGNGRGVVTLAEGTVEACLQMRL